MVTLDVHVPIPGQLALFRPPLTPSGRVRLGEVDECEVCGAADPDFVTMRHRTRGVIECHPECGEARGYVPVSQTSPARSVPGLPFAGVSGSTVGAADPVGTRSAVDAGADAQDDHRDAEGATPHPADQVDPDDTSRCPLAPECAACGTDSPALVVITAGTPVGITCATMCAPCADGGAALPPAPIGVAVRAVMAHAGHLDCTVDDLDPARHHGDPS